MVGREERDEAKGSASDRRVTAERLSSLDAWEMYRLFDEEALEPLCTLALRPGDGSASVEYAVWREGEDSEEPGTTGKVECPAAAAQWGDVTREDALRQVIYRYEEDLGVLQPQLAFRFEGPPDAFDDGDDGDDDDDDDEEDEEDEEESDDDE